MSRRLAALLAALMLAPPAAANPGGKVGEAIDRGAAYLKGAYKDGGAANANHGTGPASLVGLALLEAGVPATDPVVRRIASEIRSKSPEEAGTYQNALALLFLDRLNDTADLARIQLLGTRLYLGQLATGGYGYQLPALPKANDSSSKAEPPPATEAGFRPVKPKKPAGEPLPDAGALVPEVAPVFRAARQQLAAAGRTAGDGDNSNTQFGLIALWVAKRRGVPVDDALALVGRRFVATQNASDGGWGYTPKDSSKPAMTCAGLLGVAVGAQKPEPPPQPKDPRANDPFYNPPQPKSKAGEAAGLPGGAATRAGLALLARLVAGTPAKELKGVPGAGDEYYTLWSLERAAVALGLTTLGGADWHAWGCGFLLPAQQADGSWQGQYGADVSTSFALLFLLRANFTRDLTERIRGKSQDPGDAVLRGGIGFRPAERPDDTGPGLGAAKPGATPAARPDPDELAAALLKPDTFAATLAECRDGRGREYTAAILNVIPKLASVDREAARTALAARLTRMTAATLKAQLGDADAELRRAASVAAGVKRDKSLAPTLADRVADADDGVAQAARTALRIISGRDFGPEAGADDAAKRAARTAWAKWVLVN